MRLYLTGFMGAGKTTVGGRLAEDLGWAFRDLDAAIVEASGVEIAVLFERFGEARFRELEAAALRRTAEIEPLVVATGGGTPASAENRRWMRAHGTVVWLDVPFAELASRMGGGAVRPLWENAAAAEALYLERRPAYADCDLAVECGAASPEETAARLRRALRGAGLR